MPGYLFGYTKFKKQFETPIVKNKDVKIADRLQKFVAPFIMRRLKKDVLKELPEKIETVIYSEMLKEQKKVYNAYLAKAKMDFSKEIQANGFAKSQIKMLALLTRLRQICCHPGLFLEDYTGQSGKLDLCMELIEDSTKGGHRILLFSQFTTMLDKISEELNHRGIKHLMLTGSTRTEKRMGLVDKFNEGQVPIFLISLKAGGTGLNLTAADIVIHYDPWWNLSAQNQATDRAYRMGQTNNVQVFQLIAKDSIEEKIQKLQERKKDLTESVIREGETFISKMSEEDVLGLFERI
ncbi:MAG TPA: DEAD/DEAH box helicase, partial [Epulopiscium sp.]|nr:DEAD/DEAH box helicase [Candidatus Epulonipiscium sp.]